eukprot:m.151994 g.151994  ORF g.151994 m.151994 type:complete len:106 (+) comp20712_c2_seq2:199-516(+)
MPGTEEELPAPLSPPSSSSSCDGEESVADIAADVAVRASPASCGVTDSVAEAAASIAGRSGQRSDEGDLLQSFGATSTQREEEEKDKKKWSVRQTFGCRRVLLRL